MRSAGLLQVAGKYPDFPILAETWREVMSDHFDMPALMDLLTRIRSREVRVVAVDTPDNLTERLRGSATMYVQVDANGADASAAIGRVTGVTRVVESDRHNGLVGYEVVSDVGHDVRAPP